ncbi:MAG: hypothetical protein HYU66_16540 [Armatimonadetes bacterium]|nr:hypothetical protein [Armatimonadota bacterium]
MYLYALTYRNPYQEGRPFVMFLASDRLLDVHEARLAAVEQVRADALGNEWLEAVADGELCGPVELEGTLRQPSIAMLVS